VKTHDFIERVQGKRLDQSLVESRIDIVQKERQRVEFFNSIFYQNKG
jgi:hypothetical protein